MSLTIFARRFLAGWPGLAHNESHETWLRRMWFGLSFIVKIPLPVALGMAADIVRYSIAEGTPLPQSVTPFFGEPYSYEYERNMDRIGDVVGSSSILVLFRFIEPSDKSSFVPTGCKNRSAQDDSAIGCGRRSPSQF
jgi:hypothetical protein